MVSKTFTARNRREKTDMKWSEQPEVARALQNIPGHMHRGIIEYIADGVPCGDFLRAVISDNLVESFSRADSENILAMMYWADLMYNHVPMSVRGSAEAYHNHIKAMHFTKLEHSGKPNDIC